jgi:hypothetical protein
MVNTVQIMLSIISAVSLYVYVYIYMYIYICIYIYIYVYIYIYIYIYIYFFVTSEYTSVTSEWHLAAFKRHLGYVCTHARTLAHNTAALYALLQSAVLSSPRHRSSIALGNGPHNSVAIVGVIVLLILRQCGSTNRPMWCRWCGRRRFPDDTQQRGNAPCDHRAPIMHHYQRSSASSPTQCTRAYQRYYCFSSVPRVHACTLHARSIRARARAHGSHHCATVRLVSPFYP